MRARLLPRLDVGRLDLIWVVALVLAALAGWAIFRGQLLLALFPVLLVTSLVLMSSLSLTGWCVLLLFSAVASRGLVDMLHLPFVLTFLHYPIALLFAYVASNRHGAKSIKLPASRWMLGFLVILAISSILNATNVLRILMFLIITGESLLVIWAIQRWGVNEVSERQVMRAFWWLLAIQIPIGLWQGLTIGWQDPVQGTMVGNGAGAHLLGGLFALGMFAWLAASLDGRYPSWTVLIVALTAFGMMSAAGALQVILLSAAALPLAVFGRRRRPTEFVGRDRRRESANPSGLGRRTTSKLMLGLIVLVIAAAAPFWAQKIVTNLVERVRSLEKISNFPEVTLPLERAGVNVGGLYLDRPSRLQALVGSGPGTSSSRAALLLTPIYAKEGSIFRKLPLKPTKLAVEISTETDTSNKKYYGGSVESAQSSMLGVVGDLGIIGVFGLVLLFVGISRHSARIGSWLATALRAALAMTFVLAFIDNWLEYPEFTIPLAILIGFGTSRYGPQWGTETQTPAGRLAAEV